MKEAMYRGRAYSRPAGGAREGETGVGSSWWAECAQQDWFGSESNGAVDGEESSG
jgi:hypothetical protein